MTTTHAPLDTTRRPALLSVAAATLVGSAAFTALGTVASGQSDEHGWSEFFIVCGFSAAAVALVFGLAVARLQDGPRAGAVGLVLAVLGLLTVLVFWAGVTPALAAGGIVLGMAARRSGHGSGTGTAAMAVGALALLGYAAIYVSDWVANI